jgi:hypothetical protein
MLLHTRHVNAVKKERRINRDGIKSEERRQG